MNFFLQLYHVVSLQEGFCFRKIVRAEREIAKNALGQERERQCRYVQVKYVTGTEQNIPILNEFQLSIPMTQSWGFGS